MAPDHTPPKPRLSISTMFLSFLGCTTTNVSPVEELTYVTTSKRLTLTQPIQLNLEDAPQLTRTDSRASRVSRLSKKARNRKQRSLVIGSPSGFQHEFHVSSDNELHELELLRAEVERRVQEAAARHAEMNALARKKSVRDKDEIGSFSGLSSRRASLRPPSSISGVKRKPVPSMYPYSPPTISASWSTHTLPQLPSSTPVNSSFLQEGDSSSSIVSPAFASSLLAGGQLSQTEASSLENMQLDDSPCLTSDEADSSSMKSSPLPTTPSTSSPEMHTSELSSSQSDRQSITPPPSIGKDEPVPVETDITVVPTQDSLPGIDVYLVGVNAFVENMMTFEAGQVAKETRYSLHNHIRTMPQVEEHDVSMIVA